MKIWTHTQYMLSWLSGTRIKQVDLLIKRASGMAILHRSMPIFNVPVSWLHAENNQGAEIYIRAARSQSWPMVFLDDVETGLACRIAQKYEALVVLTSTVGGCHVWLRTTHNLDEKKRSQAQRWLAKRTLADKASTSGEHLGRLAGMRNWKRHGVWVNVIRTDAIKHPPWDPTPALQEMEEMQKLLSIRTTDLVSKRTLDAPDQSESAKEWGWILGSLEAGVNPETIYQRLYQRALPRRGSDTERYVRHTLQRAINKSS